MKNLNKLTANTLLDHFVARDGKFYFRPFEQGDYVFATDSSTIIRIRKDLVPFSCEKDDSKSVLRSFHDDSCEKYTITIDAYKEAYDKIPFTADKSDKEQCVLFSIDDTAFMWRQFSKLAFGALLLGFREFDLYISDEIGHPARFVLADGIDGMIMPTNPGTYPTLIELNTIQANP